jgi:hypothetical protein
MGITDVTAITPTPLGEEDDNDRWTCSALAHLGKP